MHTAQLRSSDIIIIIHNPTMKLAILTLLFSGTTAFTFPQRAHCPSLRMSDYDDSYPSDSSEDAHFSVADEAATIDVDNKPSSAAEATVSSLMDYLPPSVTAGISAEDRASINEAILKLEALNPTEDPVYSSELNGVWTLRYAPRDISNFSLGAVSGGYSPGLLALGLAQKLPGALVELGELEICKCIPFFCSVELWIVGDVKYLVLSPILEVLGLLGMFNVKCSGHKHTSLHSLTSLLSFHIISNISSTTQNRSKNRHQTPRRIHRRSSSQSPPRCGLRIAFYRNL